MKKLVEKGGENGTELAQPVISLSDLLGETYTTATCEAFAYLNGVSADKALKLAKRRIALYPSVFQRRVDRLLDEVGKKVVGGLPRSSQGAGTRSFDAATKTAMAPLSGLGYIRIGEDGRAYLTAKSEHYHTSVGHQFPGYALLDHASKIGVLNATHNNTRGHITRLLERELIRTANGLDQDEAKLEAVIAAQEPHVLNRVINLETGSLAMEAAIKMALARFHRLDPKFPEPHYHGKTPVFLVMADRKGGREANYHGTTVIAQLLRGLWPGFSKCVEAAGAFKVRPVAINDLADFRRAVEEYDTGGFKIAAFLHEIILMNYGGVLLKEDFLRAAYAICHRHDIPICVDEIQSCMWCPELFLFREYGLRPDFVAVGKGFPGGQYCASKIILSGHMDNLNQFGALVTNGQEELASLAYLVTMAFAKANASHTREVASYYEAELRSVAKRHATKVASVEGKGHLSTIFFQSTDDATKLCAVLNKEGIDISAQTYKADCPPSALTKIPIIATCKMVDFLVGKLNDALQRL